MRKKLLCMMAAAGMAVSIAACGGSKAPAGAAAPETTKTEGETTEVSTTEDEAAQEETAETKGDEAKFQTGTWDGLTFTNPWLNMTITFPEDSYVYSEEDMKTIMAAGQEIMLNNGSYSDSQMKLSEALTVYDFMVALPDGQSNVQMVYENTSISTGGKGIEPGEYLDILAGTLTGVEEMQYEMGDKEEVEIAGRTFTKLSATVMGGALHQDYYCTRIGNRMATMTFNYLPDSAAVAEEIIAGITAAQ